jgi:hypothetical protein
LAEWTPAGTVTAEDLAGAKRLLFTGRFAGRGRGGQAVA